MPTISTLSVIANTSTTSPLSPHINPLTQLERLALLHRPTRTVLVSQNGALYSPLQASLLTFFWLLDSALVQVLLPLAYNSQLDGLLCTRDPTMCSTPRAVPRGSPTPTLSNRLSTDLTVTPSQHHSTDNQTVLFSLTKSKWLQPLDLHPVNSSPNSTGASTDALYEFICTKHSSHCPSLLLGDFNAHTSDLDASHDPSHSLPP